DRLVRRPSGCIRREEARLVERRERALLGVGREIVLEPRILCRSRAVRDVSRVGVEHDDVPRAEIEAVVALAARPGAIPEIVECPVRTAALVLVVAQGGPGTRLQSAPRGVVAGLIVGRI